ncbi:deoxyribodipyrimidine photo-lyase [Nitriliruptoraceae bacterium ZYF776]|nr:deoxyribodipyrimidine photo-lyase [Profundirhabdus halotolerans]
MFAVARTAVVLFTRDLRVHDHPALATACREADRVVPLFVFDPGILGSRYAAPNRVANLLACLRDLRSALGDRGGGLVVRRGEVADEVATLVEEVGADEVHLSGDVSAYARRRVGALRGWLDVPVQVHPGVTVVDPEAIRSSSGGAFRVFTPYWRRWSQAEHRPPEDAPSRVPTPSTVATGRLPSLEDLVDGDVAPELPVCGEVAAREQMEAWFEHGIADYDEGRDRLPDEATSRFSHHLHLGALSAGEVVARLDRRRRGHETFLQELCWRDYNHQLLHAYPDLWREDLRGQGDDWRDDDDAFDAWREGRTGYPAVDAGMRQLLREGWMHNRARMLTASFLTKHLRIDWRRGAWHFMDHLVDGDLANNFAQWQWTAGTGTDSRPNRMFNPVTQSQRFDPDGVYIRRYVQELADVDGATVHTPWEAAGTLLDAVDYPPPLVDHAEARERFLADRGR